MGGPRTVYQAIVQRFAILIAEKNDSDPATAGLWLSPRPHDLTAVEHILHLPTVVCSCLPAFFWGECTVVQCSIVKTHGVS